MSKENFSKNISELMYKKIKAIEYKIPNVFLEKDENFDVVLCLAYMTLSKEKIIAKDMKNKNRMDRLSYMVDLSEIDKVFDSGFAKEMPAIKYAKENNNLWILDNIRDSIMHGSFDIDEDRKCFLINNQQHDRELIAEIPFSWFVAYAKNDILSKKQLDNYTIRGFYYNKDKKDKQYLHTSKELINNILYKVDIIGNKFNANDIENRIKELFELYSKNDFDDSLIESYKTKIDSERVKYNEKYLVSFYIASEKVKECIEKEFPGTDVKISIENRKHKLSNKVNKALKKQYFNYDLMFDEFNRIISPKGTSLLKYLSSIIENLDTMYNVDYNNTYELKNFFNSIINNKSINYTNYRDIDTLFEQNLKILRSICLNVYGLSTLVINHEGLYSNHFLNQSPRDYGIRAISKNIYLEFAKTRKNIMMKILDCEISLYEKTKQLNNCTNESAKEKIHEIIKNINLKKSTLENELNCLQEKMKFEPYIMQNASDFYERYKIDRAISEYYEHFNKATTINAKKKIKKVISKLIDAQIEEDSKYIYGYCNDMKDVLTIIRNSFSHIGRIYIGKDLGSDTFIVLNDYDIDYKKSGEVVCKYIDLIDFLRAPYISSVEHKQK